MARRAIAATALAAVALAALGGADASFVVEQGKLKILFPPMAQGTYNVSLANFGVPFYGGELQARVVYPPTNRDACAPFGGWSAGEGADPGEPTVVMVDRGNCPFTLKTLHVQQANASALLVVDNRNETLITMDTGSDDESQRIARLLQIPAMLVNWRVGHQIEGFLLGATKVVVNLDWTDVVPAPDERVEWEFWSNSDDNCGVKCDNQKAFIRDFAPVAKKLEKDGFTQFTPHYITWMCPKGYEDDQFCKQQCINRGRYCCPDPEDDLSSGYDGYDVIMENLRQLCLFQQVNATGRPWLWWDYTVKFGDECTMQKGTYDEQCARTVASSLPGVDLDALDTCIGDPEADAPNPLMEYEKWSQVNDGRRGDISIMPTVIANGVQFRGNTFDYTTILRFICSAFSSCLLPDICNGLVSNSEHACQEGCPGTLACAADPIGKTQCSEVAQDPGFECLCPKGMDEAPVDGVLQCKDVNECAFEANKYEGCTCERCVCHNKKPGEETSSAQSKDYTDKGYECYETEADPCAGNGGCWADDGFTACVDNIAARKELGVKGKDPSSLPAHSCVCPPGFEGDGVAECVDRWCETFCTAPGQKCHHMTGNHTCVFVGEGGGKSSAGGIGLGTWLGIVVASVAVMAVGAYALYKYRLRSYMDQEIRQIMSQYMPLDKEFDEDAPAVPANVGTGDDNAL
eukprot:CAMPEP_0183792688 /NCGR_PEP_ID=MMETSP0803_2-20130417/2733_1 /TAXON_ID=195967 /ORGANISM="Crustomastix stigmata, Strain CCMP3273" /LENGTH=687 /DNA_ID=CAMNT_0026037053 /DNA_START=123 /DNA_END=2186 /DNA_ORIENTATION=-